MLRTPVRRYPETAVNAASQEPLLHRIVGASGLSPIFAESTVRRALTRVGIDPDAMTPADIARGLPSLEKTLVGYLGDAAAARIEAIRDLAQ